MPRLGIGLGVGRSRRPGGVALHADTLAYSNNITAAGGTISQQDLNAVDTFVKAIYTAGLRDAVTPANSIIQDCCVFAGNSLAASSVKLWFPSGVQNTLSLFSFVEADYSRATGLTSASASSKHARTGYIPSTHGMTLTSCHASFYNRTNGVSPGSDICGQDNTTTQRLLLNINFSSTVNFDSWNATAGQGRVSPSAFNPNTGLVVGSRTSATDSRYFYNGSQLASISGSGGAIPISQVGLFCQLTNGTTASSFGTRSCGFYSLGLGIPSGSQTAFYNAVQQLMTAFERQV